MSTQAKESAWLRQNYNTSKKKKDSNKKSIYLCLKSKENLAALPPEGESTCRCLQWRKQTSKHNKNQVRIIGKIEIYKLAGLMNFLLGCSSGFQELQVTHQG